MKLIIDSLINQGMSEEDATEQYHDALVEAEEYPDDAEDIFFCSFCDLDDECLQDFLKDVEDEINPKFSLTV